MSTGPREPAVLIVSHRRVDALDRALASVEKWLPEAPVLVWDNRSPQSPAVAELAARRPGVQWTLSESNVGYAIAVNRLVAQVPGRDLLLLHPDAELLGPLTRAREVLAEPGVAVVAPTAEDLGEPWDAARRAQTVVRDLTTVAGLEATLRGRAPSDLYPAAPREVDGYLTGGCLLLARRAWEAVGELDDWFFAGGEDAAWQREARAAGWSLRLVDDDGPQVRRTVTAPTVDDPWEGRREDLRRASQALVLGTGADHGPGGNFGRGRVFSAGALTLDRLQAARRGRRRERRAVEARRAEGRPTIVVATNGVALGGAERQRVQLANELVARGHPVVVVCMQHLGILLGELDPRVRLVFQPFWQPVVDVGTDDAIVIAGGTRTEIAFALGWRAQARVAGGRRWWLPALHDPAEPDRPTFSDLQARALRSADAMLVLSAQHHRDLTRHQRLHDTVMVAPNGLPAAPALPFRADPAGPLRFGMLSRIKEYKNPMLLIHALDALGAGRRREWTLDIFGEGPDRERLTAETPEHLRDRVRWRGPSPGPDHAFAEFDVLCLPSGFEAFPLAIVEAMLRGMPVMASASGSVAEMLDHGRAGVVVDPVTREAWTAALEGVLADRDRTAALGEQGRRWAQEHYTVSAMTDAYQRAFARVLGRPIPGGPEGAAAVL
ncbi:glycosyltransferase [Actinomycetospora sp. TBRC 11914]|uniref:glycosyltransferase n=1 Tax=Actinomycetospora sp. TBRC 11914 TaxID=2729387 RepID=UPI00145CFD73|nr:glycosyltransferase [Actinomycetospora sp. TBRC 11914]NMO92806.1 glycosyltransferase [Actinomycetospora sp. TBRC 11914]